ncbi:MAG: hypothetical protein IJS05_06320 [Paludibacteraceae bacterium]|nr:hypothetical protein [Paludibacteraceae bacterium]
MRPEDGCHDIKEYVFDTDLREGLVEIRSGGETVVGGERGVRHEGGGEFGFDLLDGACHIS